MESNTTFKKALDRFRDSLTHEQKEDFTSTTLHDVKDEIKKIQERYGSSKKLRNMARLSKFLEAMEQLDQVVSVFLNVSPTVAFIWGPMKLFLATAGTGLRTLEYLLDAYGVISEVIPDLQEYTSLFHNHSRVLEVLELYYEDILRFHFNALDVFGRPVWRRAFDSAWKTFESKFKPILESLKRHRDLLAYAKSTAAFTEIQSTKETLEKKIDGLRIISEDATRRILSGLHERKEEIAEKLGHPGLERARDHHRLPEKRSEGSGDWILHDSTFAKWLDPMEPSSKALYLNGKPGAGKTTLISRVIDLLESNATQCYRPLVYFYFEHMQDGKMLMTDMLRAFIVQLLYQDDSILNCLQEQVLGKEPSHFGALAQLEKTFLDVVLAQKRCYIIVDGLDESEPKTQEAILQWLNEVLIPESNAAEGSVKLLVSGQRNGILDQNLDCPSIKLDVTESHLQDIGNYSSNMVTLIRKKFGISDKTEIAREVSEASKGMFMYAKVVLENLLDQTSAFELEAELQKEYPENLDKAYERVSQRVLDQAHPRRKAAALSILRWTICAARPLKWREIQCFFCIDAVSGTCDYRKMKVDGCKTLCSSLVESEPCSSSPDSKSEASVVVVHQTASSYLIRSGRINILQQHTEMSLFCMQYLTASAFDVNQDQDSVRSTALTGFYGAQDYIFAYWDHHLHQMLGRSGDETAKNATMLCQRPNTIWKQFRERYASENGDAIGDSGDQVDLPINSPSASALSMRLDQGAPDIALQFHGWQELSQSKRLEETIISVRQALQSINQAALSEEERKAYCSLNGPTKFKCPRKKCHWFDTGLNDQASLTEHLSQHEMSFKCPHEGCYAWSSGFPSSATLQAHIQRVHPTAPEEILFLSQSNKSSETLSQACANGDMVTVKILLQKGADIRERASGRKDRSGFTPIVVAARNGHIAICQYLLNKGADAYEAVNQIHLGLTALGEAIKRDDIDLFLALVAGAAMSKRVEFINSTKMLPHIVLALNATEGYFFATMLSWNELRSNPIPFPDIFHRFCRLSSTSSAAKGRLQGMLKAYTTAGIDQTATNSDNSLRSEHTRGDKQWLLLTLLGEATTDDNNFYVACRDSNEPAVRFLLGNLDSQDIVCLEKDDHPLFHQVVSKHFASANIIKILHTHGLCTITQDNLGNNPLHIACRSRSSQETFALVVDLCRGLINDVDGDGAAPLHISINQLWRHGLIETEARMKILISIKEFDITKRNRSGRTAFSCACAELLINVVPVLKYLYSLHPGLATMRDDTAEALCPLQTAIGASNRYSIGYLLTLDEAQMLMDITRPHLGSYKCSQLCALLAGSVEARSYALAKELLLCHDLELRQYGYYATNIIYENTQALENPDILPLLHLRGLRAYDELSLESLSDIRNTLDRVRNDGHLDFNADILRKDLENLLESATASGSSDIKEILTLQLAELAQDAKTSRPLRFRESLS